MNLKSIFTLLFFEHGYLAYYYSQINKIFQQRSITFICRVFCLRIFISVLVFILYILKKRVTFCNFFKHYFLHYIK